MPPSPSTDFRLRVAQVTANVLAIAGGLATGIGLGWSTYTFDYSCLLYSSISVELAANDTLMLKVESSVFGPMGVCNYCTFAPIVATIYTAIWFWFYCLLSDWDKHSLHHLDGYPNTRRTRLRPRPHRTNPPDGRLLAPTIVFIIILFICELVALVYLRRGVQVMCRNVLTNSGKSCTDLTKYTWGDADGNGWMVYIYLQVAQVGNWCLVLSLLTNLTVIFFRICYWRRVSDYSMQSDDSLAYCDPPSPTSIKHMVKVQLSRDPDNEETCFNTVTDTSAFINHSFNSHDDLAKRCLQNHVPEAELTSEEGPKRYNTL